MDNTFLYGLTVQGIQAYIFATNKLKAIIGASEIIEKLCTTWFDTFLTTDELANGKKHLNAAGNIRFQTDKETAERIFKEYHFELLEKAPGVPFSQAVVKIENGKENEAIQKLDEKLRAQRNKPLHENDLGIMARSKYRRTGDFAILENTKVDKSENQFLDVVTSKKYDESDKKILTQKIKIENYQLTYPSEFKELAKEGKHSWLALVHIDGNGIGKIINTILDKSNDKFKDLKEFSTKVNDATIKAFKKAIKKVVIPNEEGKTKYTLPIRPIIIGGDDVTVIIRADLALAFTSTYLETFEEETKNIKTTNNKGLTACAGIAYIKEKFPFHYAANLAEELCIYAKNESKRTTSAIQFYMVNDSIIDNYDEIIERELTTSKKFIFQNGPYSIHQHKELKSLRQLTQDVSKLKKEDSPKNGMREWVDAKFNKPSMAKTLKDRLNSKAANYEKILKNEKAFIDYHTLLAVNTKTD